VVFEVGKSIYGFFSLAPLRNAIIVCRYKREDIGSGSEGERGGFTYTEREFSVVNATAR
jgi:hypothetical protein